MQKDETCCRRKAAEVWKEHGWQGEKEVKEGASECDLRTRLYVGRRGRACLKALLLGDVLWCCRMCYVNGVKVGFHGKACFFSLLGQIFNFFLAQVLSQRGESFKM